MPAYEWLCDSCGNTVDKMSSIKDRDNPPVEPCELCGYGSWYRPCTCQGFKLGQRGTVGWASNGYADNVLGNAHDYNG